MMQRYIIRDGRKILLNWNDEAELWKQHCYNVAENTSELLADGLITNNWELLSFEQKCKLGEQIEQARDEESGRLEYVVFNRAGLMKEVW